MSHAAVSRACLVSAKLVAIASMVPFAGAMVSHDVFRIRVLAVAWFAMLLAAGLLATLAGDDADHREARHGRLR